MATTLSTGPDQVKTNWDYENVVSPSNSLSITGYTYTGKSMTTGTLALQNDRIFFTQYTIVGAASQTITLTSMTDAFGNVVSFARVKSLYFELTTATTATSILIGNATNALLNWLGAAAHTVRVRNGMVMFLGSCPDATGYVVTASTADQIKILNEDAVNSATVNVRIVGCSA